MEIRRLERTDYPMELIYLADPDELMVAKYLSDNQVYGLVENEEIIGVCVLCLKTQNKAEIMNVAIKEELQGRGLGRYLLEQVLIEAKKQTIIEVEIATGNSSLGQLVLYQSLGFEKFAEIPNYFVEHYPEPIYENGLQCKDQIWLKRRLLNEVED
ncbi:GNAT family N-acetyltransferase [Carnobacterium gallinarum]|uniref:GNAT family N-acetyltransferase n=1 Tax=Carnobacterium gallinarum TaxID=2749 RepID=UPI0005580D56|nr:GNAT family N-acetyltransferase [Carnobacterium gallinarum]